MISKLALLLFAVAVGAGAQPNILLICVDDLRPELASFGAEYIHSPNIDRLAGEGRAFHRHYVNAPSCGPSRFTMLTGRYAQLEKSRGNEALFDRAKQVRAAPESVPPSMPEWFRKQGYTTVSVGKVSHHPGGRGGENWDAEGNDELPDAWDLHLMPCGDWQHPRGAMHGLANGQKRVTGVSPVFESVEGDDSIYPDGLIMDEGLKQLNALARGDNPFFLAVGLIKPHLPFGAPAKYMKFYEGVELPAIPHPEKPSWKSTWHGSGEFMKQYYVAKDPRKDAAFALEVRRHYAACVSYADANVGKLLDEVTKLGLEEDTVIVLWGDHGWHLGEHAMWGKHVLFEEALRSPLIIRVPGMTRPGKKSDAVVETRDLFPTLCDLAGVPVPAFAEGQTLRPQLEDPAVPGHDALAYHSGKKTLRTDRWRLILHTDGYVELYDHAAPEKENLNVAEKYPDVVSKLTNRLNVRRQATGVLP